MTRPAAAPPPFAVIGERDHRGDGALVEALAPAAPHAVVLGDRRSADRDGSLASLQAWLAGGERTLPKKLRRVPTALAGLWAWRERDTLAAVPDRMTLIVCGWAPWTGALPAVLARRPRSPVIAVLDAPITLDWPEYATPAAVAALPRALEALGRHATLVVVPDKASGRRLVEALPRATIRVEPRPSRLAGTHATPLDPALATHAYMVACGPIEAHSNALLLLHLWRDGLARGEALPRLILAGPRGAGIEDIAPMLDWASALRSHVTEAPGLSAGALRTLLGQARALLAPTFADPDATLLRDARACGIPVIAAAVPAYREVLGEGLLSPIDGLSWRAAIRAAAARPPNPLDTVLPDWPDYAARILRHAEAAG